MTSNNDNTAILPSAGYGLVAKKQLLVSVSGGETSMYMAWWLWTFKRDEFEMIFVLAMIYLCNRN